MSKIRTKKQFSFMINMSIQPLWLTHFIENLLVPKFQLTKFIVGTFSYKAHFRPQISSNVSANLHMVVAQYINYEGFGHHTISNKYSFLSRTIQLGSFLFWYMNKHWTTKYLQITYLWFLSGEYLFWGFALWDIMLCTDTDVFASSSLKCI